MSHKGWFEKKKKKRKGRQMAPQNRAADPDYPDQKLTWEIDVSSSCTPQRIIASSRNGSGNGESVQARGKRAAWYVTP